MVRKEFIMKAIVRALEMLVTGNETVKQKQESLKRRKEYLNTIKSVSYGDKVMSSNVEDIADKVVEVVDEEKKITDYVKKLLVLEKAIFQHMEELSPIHAYIITQYYFGQKTTGEISTTLKWTRKTIANKLNAGLVMLEETCADELRKVGFKND